MRGISSNLLMILSIFVLIQTAWMAKEIYQQTSNKKYKLFSILGLLLLNLGTLAGIWLYFYDPQKIRLAINYTPYYRITGWAVLIYAPQIVYSGFSLLAMVFQRKDTSGFRIRIAGSIISIITFIYLLHGLLIDPYRIRIIEIPVKADIPAEFDGYRIVQVSDVHLAFFKNNPKVIEKAVRMINQLNPDIVCYTGDMFNNYAEEMVPFIPTLSNVKTKDGSYSILGNHDYGDYSDWNNDSVKARNFKGIIKMHEAANIQMLRDETVVIRRGNALLNLVGVEFWKDEPKYRRGNLKKALEGVDTDLYTILLTHDPEHWEKEVINLPDINLALTGHLHGAQVGINLLGLEFSPAQLLPYKIGKFSHGDQIMYVNRGFGCVGYPGRPGMQPEITLFELKKKLKAP